MDGIKRATVVTGTIGNDIHSLRIKVIEYSLRNEGFEVASLDIETSMQTS